MLPEQFEHAAGRRLLTGYEVAELLGISWRLFKRLRAEGALPAIRVGERSYRYDPADVEAFIASRREGRR
jgi:excisionase family DNA binding protein